MKIQGFHLRAVALSTFFGAICFLYRYLTFRGFNNDHYEHLSRAQQILLGDLPVRDFVQQGLPLMDMVSAGSQALLGRTLFSEVLLVFGCLGLAAALTCWILLRLTGSYLIASVMTLLQILVFPRSYSYPKLLLYPIAVIAIDWYVRAPSVAKTTALAALTVVAFLMRHDHGLFIAAGCVAAIIVHHWRHGRSHVLQAAGSYAILTAVMLSPYLIYVQWTAGLRQYVREAIGYSAAEARAYGPVVPTFAFEPHTMLTFQERLATIYIRWTDGVDDATREVLERGLQVVPVQFEGDRTWRYRIRDLPPPVIERIVRHPSVEDTAGLDRTTYTIERDRFADACRLCIAAGPGLHVGQNAEAWLYYVAWAAVLGGVVLVFAHPEAAAPATVAALTAMTALASAGLARHILSVRLPDPWGPLAILFGLVAAAAWRVARWRPALRSACLVVLVVTAAAVAVIGNVREELNVAGMTRGGWAVAERFRQVTQELSPVPGAMARRGDDADPSMLTYIAVCTAPSDRFLAFGNMPEMFYSTRRGFAAGRVEFRSGFQNSDAEQRVAIVRWRAQSVPLVVAYERDFWELGESFPLIAAEIRRRYSLVHQVAAVDDRGPFLVLAERTRAPESIYHPLGIPCFTRGETQS